MFHLGIGGHGDRLMKLSFDETFRKRLIIVSNICFCSVTENHRNISFHFILLLISKMTDCSTPENKVEPKDLLSEGLVNLLKPAVEETDKNVTETKKSQFILRENIDKLSEELLKLSAVQKPPIDLDPYVRKLVNCRRKVTLVNSVLQNTHERLTKLQTNINKEINKKRGVEQPATIS